MRANTIAVMAASLLACGVTSTGIYVISKHERWGRGHSAYFVCFAAGVLISASFLHIISESIEMSSLAPLFLLAGFLALLLLNRFLTIYVCNDGDRTNWVLGIVPMLGIGFHSFLDGVIYSVAFRVSVFTGTLAAIGMALHEFPEGIVTFVLLELGGGMESCKAAFHAFMAAALTTLLGALVYGGATHLLPAVESEHRKHSLLALAAGVVMAAIAVLSKQ